MSLPRRALVLGSSGGIGAALVAHLAATGWEVVGLSRSEDGLDLTDESSLKDHAARLAGQHFDWIVVATGILAVDGVDPERAFRQLDPAVMLRSYAVNAVGPALAVKHFAGLLPRDRPSVFAALSARLASVGDNRLGGWMSYRASKTALNQLLRCAAIELRRKRPEACIVGLHPGTIETEMSRPYARGRFTADAQTCATQLAGVLSARQPQDSGFVFDYAGERIPF